MRNVQGSCAEYADGVRGEMAMDVSCLLRVSARTAAAVDRFASHLRLSLAAVLTVAFVLAFGGLTTPAFAQDPPAADEPAVLVFSKTAAFRHSSIPAGVRAIRELGEEHGFAVEATEDAGAFTPENLDRFDAVVWLSTTGDVLDTAQQAAFEEYIRAGGGYAGVHAASDTEYTWNWYGGLVGSYFNGHPAVQEATVEVADRHHPSTEGLPARWTPAGSTAPPCCGSPGGPPTG